MSKITIQPYQCKWENPIVKTTTEKSKVKHTTTLYSFAPLLFGSFVAMPEMSLFLIAFAVIAVLGGPLHMGETYEEEFMRKFKEELAEEIMRELK